MKTVGVKGVEVIDLGGQRPEQKWVFDYVMNEVEELFDRVSQLDWFTFRQLLGDEKWQYLTEKKQHHGAGRCFANMVENDFFPVERVRKTTKGMHYYKVKH